MTKKQKISLEEMLKSYKISVLKSSIYDLKSKITLNMMLLNREKLLLKDLKDEL